MWNQDRLTKSFGYSSLYAKPVSDKAMYNMICDELDTIRQPFFIQAVTMGSHTPFEAYKDSSDLKIPTNLPELLKNYLKCINYTDKAISGLLRKIQEDKNLSNTTLIIMGDHTIFGPEKRSKLIDACKKVNLPLSINKAFVPLIINSQNINKHIQISDTVYQMDVYPTILHLIPNNGFYWKGLGVNLLDKNTRNHRIIKSSQAYQISDKIIRSNYFYKVLPK
jgi:phosphoglycerol transferase MdoB-like AlkP superfamily enzyme